MMTARVLILCALAAATACHQDAGTPPPPKVTPARVRVPVAVKAGPSAAELTAGMVEAAAVGKSQLPIALKFDLKQRPKLGEPLDIDFAVLPQIDAGAAAIQVTGGDGLTAAPGAAHIDLPALEAGQVYHQTVRVTPNAEGVLVLSLSILLKHDETTDSRAFALPLIVER